MRFAFTLPCRLTLLMSLVLRMFALLAGRLARGAQVPARFVRCLELAEREIAQALRDVLRHEGLDYPDTDDRAFLAWFRAARPLAALCQKGGPARAAPLLPMTQFPIEGIALRPARALTSASLSSAWGGEMTAFARGPPVGPRASGPAIVLCA
jgi:hypothetical protein